MLALKMLCVPPWKMEVSAKMFCSMAEYILVWKEDRVAIVPQRISDIGLGAGVEVLFNSMVSSGAKRPGRRDQTVFRSSSSSERATVPAGLGI